MSKRLIFTQISPPTDFFTYNVVGANVGAVTTSNRAALKRRANNTASGQPCCDKPEASSSEYLIADEEYNGTGDSGIDVL